MTSEAELHVRRLGGGRPLLLVHGALVTGAMFDPLVPLLSDRFELIVPDLRGHGTSGGLPPPYTVERHAADLGALIEDLGIERLPVLGYSQGGAIAQQMARERGDLVERLFLVCTFACNRLTLREKLEAWSLPWLLRLLGPKRVANAMVSASSGLTPTQASQLRAMVAATGRVQGVAALQAIRAFDSRAWLSEISCPTVVVAGSGDEAVPIRHATMLHRGIPGSELHVVDGAGHTLCWTHPRELAELLGPR